MRGTARRRFTNAVFFSLFRSDDRTRLDFIPLPQALRRLPFVCMRRRFFSLSLFIDFPLDYNRFRYCGWPKRPVQRMIWWLSWGWVREGEGEGGRGGAPFSRPHHRIKLSSWDLRSLAWQVVRLDTATKRNRKIRPQRNHSPKRIWSGQKKNNTHAKRMKEWGNTRKSVFSENLMAIFVSGFNSEPRPTHGQDQRTRIMKCNWWIDPQSGPRTETQSIPVKSC